MSLNVAAKRAVRYGDWTRRGDVGCRCCACEKIRASDERESRDRIEESTGVEEEIQSIGELEWELREEVERDRGWQHVDDRVGS